MTDFFSRLAERALGLAPVAQPDLPSMFAPLAPMELSTEMSAGSENARADRSTSDNAPPNAASQNTSTQPRPAPPVGRARLDAKSKSARARFPFAAEDNSKSESGRVLDNSVDHDRRGSADEARPQSVSRETLVRQAARPAIPDVASSSAEPPETPAPTIQVSIGRVEVRAVTSPTQAPRVVERKAPPLLSLDQYLRERNEGRR